MMPGHSERGMQAPETRNVPQWTQWLNLLLNGTAGDTDAEKRLSPEQCEIPHFQQT
jgi:hypothetical protein